MALGIACALAVTMTVTAQPTYAITTNSCKYAVFQYGVTGDCVREIQALLRGPFGHDYYHNPYTLNLAIDGGYGTLTRSAVIKFQRYYGGLAVDGVVGPQTWWGLCSPVGLNVISPVASWRAAYAATC